MRTKRKFATHLFMLNVASLSQIIQSKCNCKRILSQLSNHKRSWIDKGRVAYFNKQFISSLEQEKYIKMKNKKEMIYCCDKLSYM